jgi:hypothetical protein
MNFMKTSNERFFFLTIYTNKPRGTHDKTCML